MSPLLKLAIDHLETSHKFLLDMYEGIPSDKLTLQADAAPNHFLWTAGHCAVSLGFFGGAIGAPIPKAPDNYNALFGHGSKPVADPKAYPAFADVMAYWTAAHAAFIAHARTLTDAQLAAPCDNGGGGFIPHRAEAILSLAWHDGYHMGQLSPLRRLAGAPSLMG